MYFSLNLATHNDLESTAAHVGIGPVALARQVLLWAARNNVDAHLRFALKYGPPHNLILEVPMEPHEIRAMADLTRDKGGYLNPKLPGLIEGALAAWKIRHMDNPLKKEESPAG